MSKFAEQLLEMKIYNERDLISAFGIKGEDDMLIMHTQHSRITMSHFGTYLHYVGMNAKVRDCDGRNFRESLEILKKKSGIAEWSCSPFCRNAYVPTSVLSRAKKASTITQ